MQGVLRLRRKDVPLAAVDHHIAQTVLTPLMSDEFVLEAALDLSSEVEQFSGDDPQSVLRKLLCVPPLRLATFCGSVKIVVQCRAVENSASVEASWRGGVREQRRA